MFSYDVLFSDVFKLFYYIILVMTVQYNILLRICCYQKCVDAV